MASALVLWALPQISRLLSLDDDSLKQIITYTDTLPKEAAVDHLTNLLGDSAQALEFITSFNSRRQSPPSDARPAAPSRNGSSEVPKPRKQPTKKKQIHALPARQIRDQGNVAGAYRKRDEEDYMTSSSRTKAPLASSLALQDKPDATQQPKTTMGGMPSASSPNRAPPSASGPLVSDMLAPSGSSSSKGSRTSSPAPAKTKVSITGGTNMHGAAKTLNDLDSAIRSLELQTNPTLPSHSQSPEDLAKRKCNCMATRHPLLAIAPNCLSCGKIICVKEGLGPCTFCQSPLLSTTEIASMVRVLKDERGKERQTANNAAHRRAEVSQKPRAFTGRDFISSAAASASASPFSSAPASDSEAEVQKLDKAKEHRDKLLAFQANNAKRTRIYDEAADFDIPTSGTNMWASPAERAAQLKQQQKVLREMEWNARPEWEKRRVVASIDVVGGKIVKKMAEVERPQQTDVADDAGEEEDFRPQVSSNDQTGGAFSHNPLLGALIRPVAKADKGKGKAVGGGASEKDTRSVWRRVQDDNDDNEQWILDGGAYGNRIDGRVLGAEEHSVGS
ncbi:hypothetical protein AAFC00_001524 [Neodothiora populina]|uniref:TRIP4/RQT4 C2HC5-type zinc finger domain-containing protein n=1 Tax=Neodothiora populina TaxID=2781224 RepID=A0ABR3PPD3_9PEZI